MKIVKTGLLISCVAPMITACSAIGNSHTNADVKQVQNTVTNMRSQDDSAGTVAGQNLMNTASILARKGDHQAAIPIFRHLLASSDTLRHRSALAASLVATGQHAEASVLLQPVTQAGRGHGNAWYTLGKAWLALGRYDEALAAFSEASNRLSGDPRPRSARGVTFAALGQVKKAIDSFDMALRVRAGDSETLSNKALVLALTGNETAAIQSLESLIKSGTASARDRQNLALAYLMQGDEAKAKAMGRLDLDEESLLDTFRFYREIKGLPIKYRMRALVSGSVDPAWNSRQAGNLKLANNQVKEAAALRLVSKPVPNPKPVIKVTKKADPAIPPLLEPEGWAVQIGAYRTIKNLVRGWAILKKKNADILVGIPPRRSEKDFGPRDTKPSGFYYRLNAGPLDNYSQAKVLCQAFIKRGTDCWIRPPEKKEGKLPAKAKKTVSKK